MRNASVVVIVAVRGATLPIAEAKKVPRAVATIGVRAGELKEGTV